PFMQRMSFMGPRGERVRVRALWDGGAQVSALSTAFYQARARRLGPALPPRRRLRMADGRVVDEYGQWNGEFEVEDVRGNCTFEIFDGGGGWDVLIGKPLQAMLGAVHDMAADVVTLNSGGQSVVLVN
ncbi:hypothetical protein C8R44DRAFT_531971, partial [Mycena epipterygia]